MARLYTFLLHVRNSVLPSGPPNVAFEQNSGTLTNPIDSPAAVTAQIPPRPARYSVPFSSIVKPSGDCWSLVLGLKNTRPREQLPSAAIVYARHSLSLLSETYSVRPSFEVLQPLGFGMSVTTLVTLPFNRQNTALVLA